MKDFIGWHPQGQTRHQQLAAGLIRTQPDPLERLQQLFGLIEPWPTDDQRTTPGPALGRTQHPYGRFAVVAEEFDHLIDDFGFVLQTSAGITTAQLFEHLDSRLLTHLGMHNMGNTPFEATKGFLPRFQPLPGNFLFEANRTLVHRMFSVARHNKI